MSVGTGRAGGDAGAATVWVLAWLLAVGTAAVVGVGGAYAVAARHAAQSAADLAALAGAGRFGIDAGSDAGSVDSDGGAACTAAARVAAANGARVVSCVATSTGLRSGEVRVEVVRPAAPAGIGPVGPLLEGRARARAARLPGG